jgi:hypothetical protein
MTVATKASIAVRLPTAFLRMLTVSKRHPAGFPCVSWEAVRFNAFANEASVEDVGRPRPANQPGLEDVRKPHG